MRPITILFVFFVLLAPIPARAHAIGTDFTLIAETGSTPVPGQGGSFGFFPEAGPALDVGEVAFFGADTTGTPPRGIYTTLGGGLSVVADDLTAIPGGTGSFTDFGLPDLDARNTSFVDDHIAFKGLGSSGQQGIYSRLDGVLGRIADLGTAIPGGSGSFTGFGRPVADGAGVAFRGIGAGQEGIYVSSFGFLRVVADLGTSIPGGTGSFTGFESFPNPAGDEVANPALHADNVAFVGLGAGQEGVYTEIFGTLAVVADLNTDIPGGTGKFTSFGPVALHNQEVAFQGFGSGGQSGIYTNRGGILQVVADESTLAPGTSETFSLLGPPSFHGGNVAFLAARAASGVRGIYTDVGGELALVVDEQVVIDGSPASPLLLFGPQQPDLAGSRVSFAVGFPTTRLYVAELAQDVGGGDLLVADQLGVGIFEVDPASGRQQMISDRGVIDSGFSCPSFLAVEPGGGIVVSDLCEARIFRVDPETGDQTLVSSGGSLVSPAGIDVDAAADLYVADFSSGLLRIDPGTGAQTVVSSGAGFAPAGVAVAPGDVYVTNAAEVVSVNPGTGVRTTVSSGGLLSGLGGIAVEASGDLVVADFSNGIIRIDPGTGAQSSVSSGGLLVFPQDVEVEADGSLVVMDLNAIVRVHPGTGAQSLVAAKGFMEASAGIAVVPPECGDGRDNDGDGLVDGDDPGCDGGADDLSEHSAALPCDNGEDDDGDHLADTDDPACSSGNPSAPDPTAPAELTLCQNGQDDEGDGRIDFDGGASLDQDGDGFVDAEFNPAEPAVAAADIQCGGRPWKNTEGGGGGRRCGSGFMLGFVLPLWLGIRRLGF